jgi:hypothetical protein
MGRPHRPALGGYVYLVLNRANARLPIFESPTKMDMHYPVRFCGAVQFLRRGSLWRAGRLFCFGFIRGKMREHARRLRDVWASFALLPAWFNAIELAAVLRCPDIMACRRPNTNGFLDAAGLGDRAVITLVRRKKHCNVFVEQLL